MSRSFQTKIGAKTDSFNDSEIENIENANKFYDILMEESERNQFVQELFHNVKDLGKYPIGFSFNTIRIIVSKDLFAFIKNDNKKVMEYTLRNKIVDVLQEVFPNKKFEVSDLRPLPQFKEKNPIDWRNPYIIAGIIGGVIAGVFYLVSSLIGIFLA